MKTKQCFTFSYKSFLSGLNSLLCHWHTKFCSLREPGFTYAHKYGFTLAETLITLSILGVVASITVSQLVQNYQKTINITRLKKHYAEIVNAIDENMVLNRCDNLTCIVNSHNIDTAAEDKNSAYTENISRQRAKAVLPMITDDKTNRCVPLKLYSLNGAETNLGWDNQKQKYNYCFKDGSGLVVWNASFTAFERYGVNCNSDSGVCATMAIYTGGGKQKAIMGRNVFAFNMSRKGIIRPYTNNNCSKTSADSGYIPAGLGCFNRILKNGWRIDY